MRQKNLLLRIATFALSGALLMPSVFGASGMIVSAEEAPKYDSASAVNYSNILDDMVDFGVFANTFTQNEHMESTLAVGTFTNKTTDDRDGKNNDVDFLTKDSTAHIVVGNITNKMRFGKTTAGTFKFELSQSLYDEFIKQKYSKNNNKSTHFVFDTSFFDNNPTVQVSTKDVSKWVSDKIEEIKAQSKTLKDKNAIKYSDYIKTESKEKYLDLSSDSFEGKTVYINIDSNLKKMLSEASGLKIKKNSSTVIVFNYNGNDSITFNKFEVHVKQPNGSFMKITSETPWQGNEGTGNQTATNVDKEVCQKIIWNITDNPKVKLNTTAGVFLAPNCNKVEIYQGSCAGWLVADNVTSNKEWHYIYRGGSQEITTDKVGEIHFALDKAFTKEWNGINTVADTTISSNAGDYSFSLKRMKDNTYSEEADNKDHNKNASNAATGKVTFPSIAFHSGTEYATSPYYVEKGKTNHYYYKITEEGAGTRSGDILKSSGYATIDLAVTNKDGTLYFKADYTIRLGDNGKTIYKSVTNADPSSSEFRLGKFFNKVGPEPGALEVYVYEKGTTTPVEGATVTVGSESLGKTDSTGKKEKSDLDAGDYTVSVVAPENYKVSGDATKTQEVTSGNTTTYIFYVEKIPGALEVYVYEKGTTTPVSGATVSVGSESLGKTDATGKKEKSNLEAGDYTVSVVAPENYKVSGDATKTQEVTSGNTTTYIFYVEKIPGALEVYV
ncbi:MAG: hypothetical protein J5521_03865, partial [Lachnospiraceae bacterium]|nr:hypothetical protein [Lachnospiraceae bacterium]